ncbi:Lytic transglycosylase catalytic (plasmid) [Deinococcus proteolyticus MRP]|uniref:Lytic transglycosylase catalytic n=1 Tax=Deinococcus proteolyticus (strain ATCC 35074 / DSM 20540 / JCM 6276 / NBRC 101906 / NCIMB 13154 / VKM Ac-1939 / CCM 2703 / MRP) TaxID=693977 RepID=F0RQA0_DEIPM|nr:lytic transglycosylase domain-containing protein [Deinococcus proteolyticus]ADY27459.1 Lytic transglycosylase catalytic [Deinococcus proteolyticus MRP]
MKRLLCLALLGSCASALACEHQSAYVTTAGTKQAYSVPQPYLSYAQEGARRAGLPDQLLIALIYHESRFCASAVSPKGAVGLGQLMPGTAAELGVNPYDPRQNAIGSGRYLRRQLDRFGGRVDLALAAYNAGPNRVAACLCVPNITETRNYVERILATYRALGGR